MCPSNRDAMHVSYPNYFGVVLFVGSPKGCPSPPGAQNLSISSLSELGYPKGPCAQ